MIHGFVLRCFRANIDGSLLLGATLKGDDKLTVKYKEMVQLALSLSIVMGRGEIKGYIKNPHVSLTLNVKVKSMYVALSGTKGFYCHKRFRIKRTFSGQTPIVSGEIAEDFTYFIAISEQIPSAIGLGVLVDTDEL